MGPQMKLQMEPSWLIANCIGPLAKRAIRVQIEKFSFIDLQTRDKLEFTDRFEVNRIYGGGYQTFQKCCRPFGPQPIYLGLTSFISLEIDLSL